MNSAREYCRLIGNELDALETILSTDQTALNMHIAGENAREAYDKTYDEAVKELETDGDMDAYDILSQYLNETILELKILRTDDGNSTRIEMLRTCGGPRCDISRDSDDGQIVSITTYDGSEQATIRNSYPALAQHLDDIAQ
jgi:hypothetical protein